MAIKIGKLWKTEIRCKHPENCKIETENIGFFNMRTWWFIERIYYFCNLWSGCNSTAFVKKLVSPTKLINRFVFWCVKTWVSLQANSKLAFSAAEIKGILVLVFVILTHCTIISEDFHQRNDRFIGWHL